jgi:hypothetical protein
MKTRRGFGGAVLAAMPVLLAVAGCGSSLPSITAFRYSVPGGPQSSGGIQVLLESGPKFERIVPLVPVPLPAPSVATTMGCQVQNLRIDLSNGEDALFRNVSPQGVPIR